MFISPLYQITYQSLSDESAAVLDLVNEMRPEYDANSHIVEGTTKFRSTSHRLTQRMFPGHMDIRSIKICTVILLLGGCFWPFYILMLVIRWVNQQGVGKRDSKYRGDENEFYITIKTHRNTRLLSIIAANHHRSRILVEIDQHSNSMSAKSKRMHRKLVSVWRKLFFREIIDNILKLRC